jgi:hypothetical protein
MGKTAKGKNQGNKKKKGGPKIPKNQRLSKVKGTAPPPGRRNTW